MALFRGISGCQDALSGRRKPVHYYGQPVLWTYLTERVTHVKTLIVFAHPNPDSFNGAIRSRVEEEVKRAGGEFKVHDLYRMNFRPILMVDDFNELFSGRVPADVQPLQADITWADQIALVFPTWWSSVPAIMKGYFDRVLTNGFAYQYGRNGAEGLLTGKKAIVFQTTGTPGDVLEPTGTTRAMQKALDDSTLAFCGIEVIAHEMFYAVTTVTDEERKDMLERVGATMQQVTPAPVG